MPRVGAIYATVALLVAYLAVSLYPFEWMPPRTENSAAFSATDGIEFAQMGIAHSAGPPAWLDEAIRTHKITIRLEVRATPNRQRGLARILTLSEDTRRRNLTIGQDYRDLVIRLRTPDTGENGFPPFKIAKVFGRSDWLDILITIVPERLVVRIDDEIRLSSPLPSAPLRTWNPSYRLALGNELTGDRSWLGKIRQARITVGGTSVDYAVPGALEVPKRYWLFHRRFNFVPLTETTLRDCLQNFVLFIPLGFLLCLLIRQRGLARVSRTLLFAGFVSMILEMLQVGFTGRFPSLNDILFNLLGSIAGMALAIWLFRTPFSKLVIQRTDS